MAIHSLVSPWERFFESRMAHNIPLHPLRGLLAEFGLLVTLSAPIHPLQGLLVGLGSVFWGRDISVVGFVYRGRWFESMLQQCEVIIVGFVICWSNMPRQMWLMSLMV